MASCLPFVPQLPVFFSLFYMLRTDLKIDICGEPLVNHYNALPLHQRSLYHVLHATSWPTCRQVRRSNKLSGGRSRVGQVPVHTRHHRQGHWRCTGRVDRRIHRLPDPLDADGDRLGRPQSAAHDIAAAGNRRLPVPLSGWSAGVLDHHQPVDDRSAVLHSPAHRTLALHARKGDWGWRKLPMASPTPLGEADQRASRRLRAWAPRGGPPPPPRRRAEEAFRNFHGRGSV